MPDALQGRRGGPHRSLSGLRGSDELSPHPGEGEAEAELPQARLPALDLMARSDPAAPCQPRLGFPYLGDGIGLRDVHFAHLARTDPSAWDVDWFEILSENFLDHRGYAAVVLERVAANRPVVM